MARIGKTFFINEKGLSVLREKGKGGRYVSVNVASPHSINSLNSVAQLPRRGNDFHHIALTLV
jgi:DnaJ-class molecular chaperone